MKYNFRIGMFRKFRRKHVYEKKNKKKRIKKVYIYV
jgi:hypothetical protein